MQTLARVNRTFRGKEDGLLVAYAPLADNLAKALGEYTQSDQANKPVGRNVDEAIAMTVTRVSHATGANGVTRGRRLNAMVGAWRRSGNDAAGRRSNPGPTGRQRVRANRSATPLTGRIAWTEGLALAHSAKCGFPICCLDSSNRGDVEVTRRGR